jgi:hypothetical protein
MDSGLRIENLKGQLGTVLQANNEKVVNMGIESANRIREVITIQNESNKNPIEIRGDVKILMQNLDDRWKI